MLALRNLAPWKRSNLQRYPRYGLQRDFERMFDNFFNEFENLGMQPFASSFTPSLDISENDQEIKVTAELPGLDEKDIDVSLTQNVLTISGEKKTESEDKGDNYHYVERSYGSFRRSVTLPAEVEADKVDATFKNGVLSVTLPKTAEAQEQAKKIKVNS